KQPDDRYQTPAHVAAALDALSRPDGAPAAKYAISAAMPADRNAAIAATPLAPVVELDPGTPSFSRSAGVSRFRKPFAVPRLLIGGLAGLALLIFLACGIGFSVYAWRDKGGSKRTETLAKGGPSTKVLPTAVKPDPQQARVHMARGNE